VKFSETANGRALLRNVAELLDGMVAESRKSGLSRFLVHKPDGDVEHGLIVLSIDGAFGDHMTEVVTKAFEADGDVVILKLPTGVADA
jgi:hypothetical protein